MVTSDLDPIGRNCTHVCGLECGCWDFSRISMTLTIVSCRIPPIYRGNRAGLQRRSGESRLVSFLSPGTGQWVSWAPPSGEKRPFLRVCCEPDPVIKGTSKEAAQPTEPSACPADWVLLGKIIAYSASGVEDRKKLCPLHTHKCWSREYIQV